MGNRCTTTLCDLSLRVDTEEVRNNLKEIESEEGGGWNQFMNINEDGVIFMDVNWKIIGYWFEDTYELLKELNKYIVGNWGLIDEQGSQVEICFPEDPTKDITIRQAYIEWENDVSLDDFYTNIRVERKALYKALHKEDPVKSVVDFIGVCEVCGYEGKLRSESSGLCESCWVDISLDDCEKGCCNHAICHGEEDVENCD